MATKTTEERRTQAGPLEEAQEAVVGGDGSLKRAAMTAAAAAIAGGLAGAAQELLSRRGERDEDAGEDAEPQAEADEQEHAEEDERDEPSAEAEEDEAAEHDEEDRDAENEELDAQDDEDEEQDEEPHAEADARGDTDDEPGQDTHSGDGGAPPGGAAELVRAARRQLEELIGEAPESVSGVRRTDGGWAVTFEVVELRRIPETTDVLSSYEVKVDDEGNLLDLERRRRYRRSQVEDS